MGTESFVIPHNLTYFSLDPRHSLGSHSSPADVLSPVSSSSFLAMSLKKALSLLVVLSFTQQCLGNPLKFPEGSSVGEARAASSLGEAEPRLHHHKKKKKKFGNCGGGGHGHHRFKREDPEGRFFFPILNYYDTNVYINNDGGGGGGSGEGCGGGGGGGGGGGAFSGAFSGAGNALQGLGQGLGGGLGGIGNGVGSSFETLSSGVSNGIGSISNGIGGIGNGLGGIASHLPSIGNGLSPLGGNRPSFNRPQVRPTPAPARPPVQQPVSRPPPPVTTTDEDYDYSDFSTTRTRPIRPSSSLSDYPIVHSISNSIRPVFERPQRAFNQYVVRPINRTIKEFYSLF